jgi:hypothetical protein
MPIISAALLFVQRHQHRGRVAIISSSWASALIPSLSSG